MPNLRSLESRMIRAARLEVDLYEEVEADTSANGQAFAAVVIASLSTALGTGILSMWTEDAPGFGIGLVLGLASSIAGWLAWSVLAYYLGTTLFKGPETSATIGELLRTIGFSNSPRVLGFLVFIPFLGWIISLAASIWALVAGVIAVRQALDFSTWRAIGTCITGWIIYVIFLGLVLGVIL